MAGLLLREVDMWHDHYIYIEQQTALCAAAEASCLFRRKLDSHVISLVWSHGEADVNKMEISVVKQPAEEKALQWEKTKKAECEIMRWDLRFLSSVVCKLTLMSTFTWQHHQLLQGASLIGCYGSSRKLPLYSSLETCRKFNIESGGWSEWRIWFCCPAVASLKSCVGDFKIYIVYRDVA